MTATWRGHVSKMMLEANAVEEIAWNPNCKVSYEVL
jgi:hypothetical protein